MGVNIFGNHVGNVTSVNGRQINVPAGSTVTIINGEIRVNGRIIDDEAHSNEEVRIIIEGSVGTLQVDQCYMVEVKGDAGSVNAGGSVQINGIVKGNARAGNSMHCGDVGQNVEAGNSVHCGTVHGKVKAGNSVHGI